MDNGMHRLLTAVEFPGYIKDASNPTPALSTISLSHDPSIFELRYTSQSHPIYATVSPCIQLLVKLQYTINNDGTKIPLRHEVVGVVSKTVRFRGMSDFQYHDEIADPLWQDSSIGLADFKSSFRSNILSSLLSNDHLSDLPSFLHGPPRFSNLEAPRQLPSSNNLGRSAKMHLGRRPRRAFPWRVNFGDREYSSIPDQSSLSRGDLPTSLLARVKLMFNERPIWIRNALTNILHLSSDESNKLKDLLPFIAFFFVSGPWRGAWCLYGVDPRRSADYRSYQTLPLKHPINMSLSTPNLIIPHVFDGYDPSALNAKSFSYCDLKWPPLSEIVNDAVDLRETVDEHEGWYAAGTANRLRKLIKERLERLCQVVDVADDTLNLEDNMTPMSSITLDNQTDHEQQEYDPHILKDNANNKEPVLQASWSQIVDTRLSSLPVSDVQSEDEEYEVFD